MAIEYGRSVPVPARMTPSGDPASLRQQQELQDEERERDRSNKEERTARVSASRGERARGGQAATERALNQLARHGGLTGMAPDRDSKGEDTITKASVRGFQSGFTSNIAAALSPMTQPLRAGEDWVAEVDEPSVAAGSGKDPSAVVAQNHARFPELATVELPTGAAERFPELTSEDAPLSSPLIDVAEDLTR